MIDCYNVLRKAGRIVKRPTVLKLANTVKKYYKPKLPGSLNQATKRTFFVPN